MHPLLKQYQLTRDPAAFRLLVDAHIDAVYSQCLRQLRDKHLAEDVTQAVFFMLARKADGLPHGTVLGGWLFTAARYACMNARRGEQRRQRHEHEAAEMRSEIQDIEDAAQRDEIDRSLNDAVARLGRRDRDAVVLRFFEQLPMDQVGRRLGVSEIAARQRVSRAIARLRRAFAASGVALAEPALEHALQNVSMIKAPAALAVLSAQAATDGSATSAIGAQALKMMRLASVRGAVMATTLLASAVGVSVLAIVAIDRGADANAASRPIPVQIVATSQPAAADRTNLTVRLTGVLQDIAKACRKRDMAAIKEFVMFDDSVQSRLIMAKLEEDMNEWWLRRTWDQMFPEHKSKVLAGVFGEGGRSADEDFDDVAKQLLASGVDSAVGDGDHATLPLVDPDPNVKPGDPARKPAGIITIHYRRIDGRWRLDLRTFRATLGDPTHPLSDQAMERAADGYIQRDALITAFSADFARELETGVYETAESAEAAMAARAKSLPTNARINIKPADRSTRPTAAPNGPK